MKLIDVENEIKLCKEHLVKSGAKGTEIEAILTRYLLVYICGAYETEIKRMIVKRAGKSGDIEIESFIKNTIKTYRALRINEIRENLLGRFCDKYKCLFDSKVLGTESETRFVNIITNRHLIAHGGNVNITFDELEDSYTKAETVLEAIEEALELKGSTP